MIIDELNSFLIKKTLLNRTEFRLENGLRRIFLINYIGNYDGSFFHKKVNVFFSKNNKYNQYYL